MNNEQFLSLLAAVQKETFDLLESKGKEYSGTEDRLANFKRGAANVGVKPTTILYIYLSKHLDSIATYIKNEQKGLPLALSEPIEGRINDAINYLILLRALIEEGKIQPIVVKTPGAKWWVQLCLVNGETPILQDKEGLDMLRMLEVKAPNHVVTWEGKQIKGWRVSPTHPWMTLT